MSAVHEYQDFYAIHNHQPGSDRALRVGGTVVFRTGGWAAELHAHERGGTGGINPTLLELDLVLTAPPEGDAVPEVLTPVELAEFRLENPAIEHTQVYFHLVGGDDAEDPPPPIDVEHPE